MDKKLNCYNSLKNTKKYSVGVDIGGTTIKCGVVGNDGKILCSDSVKSCNDSAKDIINLSDCIKALLHKNDISISEIKGIGVGCPGAIDSDSGVIETLPNLGWENVEIVKIIGKTFNVPVKITNDANAAALAEYKYGVAEQFDSVVMFTIGTGIGGAVINNGKMLEGTCGKGAELGHATLVLDGIPCTCGRKGCIERYCSATALIEQTKAAMQNDKGSVLWRLVDGKIENVDGKTAIDGAKLNDKTALSVVNAYVKYLSESIMTMLNVFRPQAFILGGGISNDGDYIIPLIKKYCEKFSYGYKHTPIPEILAAKLKNDAGIIGAASLFQD